MTDTAPTEILVVGGGVGGLAAALALARQGRAVRVLEAAPAFGEIGAGIQLAPNATQALERLGVLSSLVERAVLPRSLDFMDAISGERITAVDLGTAFREHYGTPYVVVHRTDLHSALLDACRVEPGIALEVDKIVTRVEELDDGALVACRDSTSYVGKALIGADGLKSVVRTLLVDDEPVNSGYVAYRGTIPVADAVLHDLQDSMVYWWGPELHLVQYKVRGGHLYNQVGVFRSYVDDPESEAFGSPEELDERFAGTCDVVRASAAKLDRGMRWPMADRDPLDTWSRGAITLLGDAAHPMLQYLAQGGCQALEDALCLAEMVAAHDDVADAFAAYEALRVPRTARVQRSARLFGEIIHSEGLAAALRNHVLSQHAPDDFEPLDWLYKVQLAAPVPSA